MLTRWPVLLSGFLIAGSLTAGEPSESAAFTDPAKDVYVEDSNPNPNDIVKVELSSDGTFINFALTLAGVPDPLNDSSASSIAAVGIDTDNDATTGDNFYAGSPGGMEVYAEINASLEPDGGPSKSAYAAVGMLGQDWAITREAAERLKADGLVFSGRIPYETIGVTSGQVIRLVLKEVDDYSEGEGFFPAAILILQ